ncbi:MAG: hypothetical protein AAGC85_04600, partial [Bacteroidota bacterium]
ARTANTENSLVWNELFISDVQKVKGFYEGIFNWTIKGGVDGRYDILDSKGEKISAIQEISNEIKGKYEYWAVYFGVKDPNVVKEKVIANGGSLLYKAEFFTSLADPFGAFFHVIPLGETSENGPESEKSTHTHWKAWMGVGLILAGLLMDWHWLWGIFFLLWALSDLRSGVTYLFEPIHKKTNPLLYWLILMIWLGLSVYSIFSYVAY